MRATCTLVIDNSIFFRDELADKLQKYLPKGCVVERASDLATAQEKIALTPPDVIVVNFSLTVLQVNGKKLIPALVEMAHCPIIVFGSTPEGRETAFQNGATDFVLKPPDNERNNVFYRTFALRIELALKQFERRGETPSNLLPATPSKRRPHLQSDSSAPARQESPTVPPPQLRPSLFQNRTAASSNLLKKVTPVPTPKEKTPPAPSIEDTPPSPPVDTAATALPLAGRQAIDLIAIGSSTGGTEALSTILRDLRAPLPPIVIVQHIPALFAKLFAERLNSECSLKVKEGEDGEIARPNTVYIAPGGKHMRVSREGGGIKISCAPGPKVHSCCPSVDVLFESVAKHIGASALGVILTGMGKDGAQKLLEMRRKGSPTIGQDKETAVVYGMPKAAWDLGAVEQQFPLRQIAGAITSIARKR